MPGFSSITGDESIMYADNASFDGTKRDGKLTTDGQLWIGATASPHVNKGSLTSPNGTITIGYASPNITLDLSGGQTSIDSIAVQTGISPVVPTAAGLITFNGAVVAAGTNPVRTNGFAVNSMSLDIQISQTVATTNATRIGLCAFDSADFTVDANGFVQLAGASGFVWNEVVVVGPTAMTTNNGYVANNAGVVTLTLPVTAAFGTVVRVAGKGAGGWLIAQNAGQSIRVSSSTSTVGVGGSVASTNAADCIELLCTTANTVWTTLSSVGNFTVT